MKDQVSRKVFLNYKYLPIGTRVTAVDETFSGRIVASHDLGGLAVQTVEGDEILCSTLPKVEILSVNYP